MGSEKLARCQRDEEVRGQGCDPAARLGREGRAPLQAGQCCWEAEEGQVAPGKGRDCVSPGVFRADLRRHRRGAGVLG